jgi:histidyl-tRNA synthetase
MERVIIALGDKVREFPVRTSIYIATLGNDAKLKGLMLAGEIKEKLKDMDLAVLIDTEDSSLKSQMRSADKLGAKLVLIIGEDELKQGKAVIKDMRGNKEQVSVGQSSITEEVRKRLC